MWINWLRWWDFERSAQKTHIHTITRPFAKHSTEEVGFYWNCIHLSCWTLNLLENNRSGRALSAISDFSFFIFFPKKRENFNVVRTPLSVPKINVNSLQRRWTIEFWTHISRWLFQQLHTKKKNIDYSYFINIFPFMDAFDLFSPCNWCPSENRTFVAKRLLL